MRWFRDKIRQGSWLALIALVINLGLSFGHIHMIDDKVAGRGIAAMAASITASDEGQGLGHPGDDHVDYLCPICTAAAAIATALTSAPPVLPSEFAHVTIDCTIVQVLALVEPPPAAFQSRGPPIS
jgi:hypothetical protein